MKKVVGFQFMGRKNVNIKFFYFSFFCSRSLTLTPCVYDIRGVMILCICYDVMYIL